MKYITYSGGLRFFNGKTFDYFPQQIGLLIVHNELLILLIESYQDRNAKLVCINSVEQRLVWEMGATDGYLKFADFSTYPNCIVAFSSVNINYLIDIATGKILEQFREIGK